MKTETFEIIEEKKVSTISIQKNNRKSITIENTNITPIKIEKTNVKIISICRLKVEPITILKPDRTIISKDADEA
jgi:hypothetical protein